MRNWLVLWSLLSVLCLLVPAAVEATVREKLGGLAVPFVANEGQADGRVAYYAPTFAGTLAVTRGGELVYTGARLTETFRGGAARPMGEARAVTGVSSFIGDDPSRWRRNVTTYQQLGLGEVWPGVTVSLRAHARNVEKIFTVAPGASVDRIRMGISGARSLRVTRDGALVARTGPGDVTFTQPVAYQEHGGVRRAVKVAYKVRRGEYRFKVGAYDRRRPLVIDPLIQSTYLGGTGTDEVRAFLIHPTLGVYVAGNTSSTDFLHTDGGAQQINTSGFAFVAFVARLDASLTVIHQVTYLGPSDGAVPSALAFRPDGSEVYLAGSTNAATFPGTDGASAQPLSGGGSDAWIARLSADLTELRRTTFLGGSGDDAPGRLVVHPASGDVYVSGGTGSTNFPGRAGGAQEDKSAEHDAFVAQLSPDLDQVRQSTYLGGDESEFATAIAIHPASGDVYVAGFTRSTDFPGRAGGAQEVKGDDDDGFVAWLKADLTQIERSTYFGGDGSDSIVGLALHPTSGEVYVVGQTLSSDLPGRAGGAQSTSGDFLPFALLGDGFVARLNAELTVLGQSTYLGGSLSDSASAVSIHPGSGDVYVVGTTRSFDMPGTARGARPTFTVSSDAYAARLNAALTSLIQTTFLGGGSTTEEAGRAVAIHPESGDVYVAGNTGAFDFPGAAGGAQPAYAGTAGVGPDAFVARLTSDLAGPPDLTIAKVHGGNFARGQAGATYLITVTNAGGIATTGTVTVTDTLPAGLTATAIAGPGWDCTLATRTCTRDDALARAASYPAIVVTVNVAADAGPVVVNTAAVAGGGDANPANDTATDPTIVVAGPDLAIAKVHTGDFGPGQVGATYRITVTNVGSAPTAGPVSVTDTLPGGLDATAIAGPGWTCARDTMTCTRADALAAGASYAAITVTVNVSLAAPNPVTNTATVSGGGDVNPANDTATDMTAVRARFVDVPGTHPFFAWIEALVAAGLTIGCNAAPAAYCPDAPITRAQMAVLLLRGLHGAGFDPPAATGLFADVPSAHPFVRWIEQLARESVTSGCATDPLRYCPDAHVTRGEAAVFLLRAKHGPGFDPPAATGLYTDVPLGHLLVEWIEQLAREGISGGCGPTMFCPDAPVTRGQMAVLLARAFGLPM